MLKSKTNHTLCLLFTLLFAGTNSYSQDFKADMVNMKAAYGNIKTLNLKVDVNVFVNAASDKLLAKKSTQLKKSDDNYYYEMEDMIMLLNEKYSILVHKADRQIVFSNRDAKEEKKAAYSFASPGLDSTFQKHDSVLYKGTNAGLKRYVVYTSKALIKRTEIFINSSNYFIAKVVYYYNTEKVSMGNKVLVEYKVVDTEPAFKSSLFSEKSFFARSGNKLIPAKEYSGYSVNEVTLDDL